MMEGRLDSEKYQTGPSRCAKTSSPPAWVRWIKRPGTQYIATLSGITSARLVLFDAGVNGKFMAEFSPLQDTILDAGGALVAALGFPVRDRHHLHRTELSELSCVMNKGVMYIVHHNHKPAIIPKDNNPRPIHLHPAHLHRRPDLCSCRGLSVMPGVQGRKVVPGRHRQRAQLDFRIKDAGYEHR